MKKLLAVLLVAFIALGAVFADGQVNNPTEILLKYVVKSNDNVLLRQIRFRVGNEAYTGTAVVVSTGEGSTGGINVGDTTITVVDASKKLQNPKAGTVITLTPPTKWTAVEGGATFSDISEEDFQAGTVADHVTVVLNSESNKITITYDENQHIDRSASPVDIATWKLSWTEDTNAPQGEYTATIGVNITPQEFT